MLQSSLRPYHAQLGRLPRTNVYRDLRRYPVRRPLHPFWRPL
jgi:hypothetical protein